MSYAFQGLKAVIFGFGIVAYQPSTAQSAGGPKMVEIDAAGNVRTTSGRDIGKAPPRTVSMSQTRPLAARDANASLSICDPRYRWLPTGVSSDTINRTRAFYRNVTRLYENAQNRARARGQRLSRSEELGYWNAHGRFLDTVAPHERAVADRGISPRLSWWCNAPPLVRVPGR